MPQFKVTKSSDINKIENNSFSEDKLYIYKETDKFGRLFYDFNNNTRIEIGSLDNIYNTTSNLTQDVEILNVSFIKKYNNDDTFSTVNINEVQINSFVTNNKSLYNIRNIDRNTKDLTLRKIYTQQDLVWNDYY